MQNPFPPPNRRQVSRLIRALAWGLGPALILGGAGWAHFTAVRASLPLRLKASVGEFPVGSEGRGTYLLPGFRIRLESLAYAPQNKLQIFAAKEATPTLLEAREGLKGRFPSTKFDFEIERLLPQALDQSELRENPAAPDNPALRVMLGVGAPEPLIGTLFADRQEDQRREEPGGRFSVVFRRTWTPELLSSLKPHPPLAEVVRMTYLGREVEHPVKPGASWEPAPFRLKVLKAFPDFIVRANGQGQPEPASKSEAPLDPWLELSFASPDMSDRRVLLSALRPEITDSLNAPNLPAGLSLRYLRQGEERQGRFAVFTQDDHQVRLVEQGSLRRTEPWVLNRPFIVAPGLSVTPLQQFAHAERVAAFIPHPEAQTTGRWAHPALRLKVRDSKGLEETVWLEAAGSGQSLFGGGLRVAFGVGPLTSSDFTAVLSVLDANGQEQARKQIGAKDSLIYAGHSFSLASQLPAELGVIGVQVVREHGSVPVYLGCCLLLLGIGWALMVEPRLTK